ncbi:MAG: MBL fold metallo-hydrolase, partial [Desulfobulbaceae bacterium]|nr:MBL fold metallo-hydrolase [Desulfobulbaceae bacterium]
MRNCTKRSETKAVRIFALKKNTRVYSCNSYLILGDWNRVEDVNTLIDPGIDGFVLEEIEQLSTGFGKVAVEQVILTHNHFDHAAGVPAIKERYNCRVLAFIDGPGVDELLPDGHFVKAGNDILEIIHTPGHSSDSICLYAPTAKALFSGDTQLKAQDTGETYTNEYVAGLMKLAGRSIEHIYSGHDAPLTRGCRTLILQSLT